jgi:hypothetical protein
MPKDTKPAIAINRPTMTTPIILRGSTRHPSGRYISALVHRSKDRAVAAVGSTGTNAQSGRATALRRGWC